MPSLNIPAYSFRLPWFLIDLDNFQLITSRPVPGDISDTKGISIVETPVPGLSYQPVTPGGFGNRKISFTIPAIKKNNTVGNLLLLKQFENLRNQVTGFIDPFGGDQFIKGPKVLYYYGVGSIPLIYWVSKCDFIHKGNLVNQLGFPQWTDVSIELILDEENILYMAEEIFRKVSSLAGLVINTFDTVESLITGRRPN